MTLWADVLIILGIPLEVSEDPGPIVATRLVEDRDVRHDLAVDQPAQKWPGAVGGVGDQPLGSRRQNQR